VFGFPKGLESPVSWQFTLIESSDLTPANLRELTGLIVGSPWRSKIAVDEIATLVEWVHNGGRMLLLGFEFGDRHHGANLGELSRQFGIQPIAQYRGACRVHRKPYDVNVDYLVADSEPHRFSDGLSRIRLANAQTGDVDPGGVRWLCVGKNSVYRPAGVTYREGLFSQPHGSCLDFECKLARGCR
jgi:hypothetical protein